MAEEAPRRRRVRNRVLPAVIGGVIVLLVLIALLTGKEEKKASGTPVERGTRALVLPEADSARTVVIPPCGASVEETTRSVAAGEPVATAVTLALSGERGERTLLVPKCNPAATSGSGSASAAYVLPLGKRGEPGRTARLLLPSGSKAKTIVVPRCETDEVRGGQDFALRAQADDPETVIAPSC